MTRKKKKMTEKKPWSKKKKIIVGVIVLLLVISGLGNMSNEVVEEEPQATEQAVKMSTMEYAEAEVDLVKENFEGAICQLSEDDDKVYLTINIFQEGLFNELCFANDSALESIETSNNKIAHDIEYPVNGSSDFDKGIVVGVNLYDGNILIHSSLNGVSNGGMFSK